MIGNWTYTDLDERTARKLAAFLPKEVFDTHAHLYRLSSLDVPPGHPFGENRMDATAEAWREHIGRQVGESRLAGGLFTPVPQLQPAAIEDENAWVLAQIADMPQARGLILIRPESRPADVAKHLKNPRFAGFKPYHTFSSQKPTFQAAIASFLPEWAWEMADEHGLVILLHIVKDLALADPDNHREIRETCTKYPRAKLILAHVGRGFHAPNTVEGLPSISGLQNVWFDTAGVCESAAIGAVLREFGPRRLLWGTDFPVSETRGRCVTVGDGFAWLQPDNVDWEKVGPGCHPVLVGLESLRAVKEAADDLGFNEEDLKDIFCDNALRLLGMKQETGALTQELYRHAKQRIPGGTQLLSKRPEQMAPDLWPAYFREARGCETWDLDGRHYYDMSTNSVGACLLGFRHPDVTRAVQRRINLGSMCTLNPPEEAALADVLCEIHPWAEQARFARCGGEACAVAVRIARATTDRSVIAICGYHGWHDWYLAANLGESDALRGHLLPGLDPLGVPRELRGTTVTFTFNDREGFQAMLDEHGDRLAAVIMEPCRHHDPEPGFLELVREGVHRHGALLLFDEVSMGWRLHFGGAHLKFGVNPDIAVFAKALGNGYPIGAVIGTKEAMAGAHTSFISSTYWTESIGPAASLATLEKMATVNVPAHVAHVGNQVHNLWKTHAGRHGLPVVAGDGYPCVARFSFDHELAQEMRTLYTQLMLERGFLAGAAIYPTLAHTDEIVALYGAAIDEAFAEIATALSAGDVRARLKGPVAQSGFRRLVS